MKTLEREVQEPFHVGTPLHHSPVALICLGIVMHAKRGQIHISIRKSLRDFQIRARIHRSMLCQGSIHESDPNSDLWI